MKKVDSKTASLRVIRRLRQEGYEAVWAGGCVRDRLLKRRPRDYDVATTARPDEIQAIFPRTVPVGKAFGVMIVLQAGVPVEVATFRGEGGYRDGRHPSKVYYAGPKEDAQRRDFTVNGLFYDPVARQLIDLVGGQADLKRKILRAIGNPEKRFKEDHLRLLRAVRLSAQLNFKIEARTWAALKKLAPCIKKISAERIRDELTRLLVSGRPGLGLELLQRSGLLKIVLPEIEALRGVKHSPDFHPEGDVWVHTRLVMNKLPVPATGKLDPTLAWAALLHDVGKPPTQERKRVRGKLRWRFPGHAEVGERMARRILNRLKFSRAETDAICAIVGNHMTFKDVTSMRLATLKRLMARDTFNAELELHRADCLGSHGMLKNYNFLRRKKRELAREVIRPKPLVTGHDLLELGFSEGPRIGELLRKIQDKQLEGELKSRDEALAWLKSQNDT